MSRVKLSKEFEEDMILLQVEHLRQASLVVCQSVVNRLARALFDDGLKDEEWQTNGNVANCGLYEEQQLRKNVILFMFKEQLGIGPKYYQLLTSIEAYGRSCFQCLLRFLPHEKMVLHLWSMRFALSFLVRLRKFKKVLFK